jgi:hypothetical protein
MKVSRLIELLQQCSQDAEVLFWDGDERRVISEPLPVDQWHEGGRFVDINLHEVRREVAA